MERVDFLSSPFSCLLLTAWLVFNAVAKGKKNGLQIYNFIVISLLLLMAVAYSLFLRSNPEKFIPDFVPDRLVMNPQYLRYLLIVILVLGIIFSSFLVKEEPQNNSGKLMQVANIVVYSILALGTFAELLFSRFIVLTSYEE